MKNCTSCTLVERRNDGRAPLWDSIYRTPHWDVVHCNDTSLLGWLIMVTRRHVPTLADLTPEEAAAMGPLVQQVSQAIVAATGSQKVYMAQFAEAAGHQHVHIHLIPRMPGQPPADKGPRIFRHLGVHDDDRIGRDAMNALGTKIRAALTVLRTTRPLPPPPTAS